MASSCPTLCDPLDGSPPGSSVHGDSRGKNTGVGCHGFLQGIFPTQGSNPCLMSLALAGRFFTASATWEGHMYLRVYQIECFNNILSFTSFHSFSIFLFFLSSLSTFPSTFLFHFYQDVGWNISHCLLSRNSC